MTIEMKRINIRIGPDRYDILSSDQYLRQMRPGFGRKFESTVKAMLGIDAFEPRLTKLIQFIAPKDGIALDVGANIGCTSLLLSGIARAVVAFEPVPTTFDLLSRNVKAAGKTNISLHNFALGSEQKQSTMYYAEADRSGAFVADNLSGEQNGQASISIRPLDSVWASLALDSLDFMKIDVEGYELNVLKGASRTLQQFRPIIEMEANSWCLNVMQRLSLPDFVDFVLSTFPEAYAVEDATYLDLRIGADRWRFFERNVLHQQFRELVVGYGDGRLRPLLTAYKRL